jgi:hypothetical protein
LYAEFRLFKGAETIAVDAASALAETTKKIMKIAANF